MAQASTTKPQKTPIDPQKLITFVVMVFGMFMAILDIQIVSASLTQIQAGLSASSDEIAWVQTSYLIAEVIMIPLSGTLSRMLSTRWMFTLSAAGFTLMSLMCALSSNINEMILWRALQGFIGGGMIPTVFATAYTIFPPDRRSLISPVIGLVATLAPTIGPTIGGYLTELFSWHWLFLVNIVPGIFVTVLAAIRIDFDKPALSLYKTFDWWGLAFMAIFLGSMEYVLEEGALKNWFEDDVIVFLTGAMVLGGIAFFIRVFTHSYPIVDLSAFANRNFAMGSLFSFVMGVGLYGLTYLYPLYLARIRGYSALQIGETMFVSGLAMAVSAPLAGRMMGLLDARVMMGLGFGGFAVGTWIVTGITADWDFWELFVPQILRGISLMICMVPINNISLGTLPPAKLKDASGVFNLTRNLGGAVGLALINTLLANRLVEHTARLSESVTWDRPVVSDTLAAMTRALSSLGTDARTGALYQLQQIVTGQASVMSFADTFLALTILFLLLLFMLPMVKRTAAGGGGGGGH